MITSQKGSGKLSWDSGTLASYRLNPVQLMGSTSMEASQRSLNLPFRLQSNAMTMGHENRHRMVHFGSFLASLTVTLLVMACTTSPTPSPVNAPSVVFPNLHVIAEPREAAEFLLNPDPLRAGGYTRGMTVTIDMIPRKGWELSEWIGPVYATTGKTAKIDMDVSQTVVVRFVRVTPHSKVLVVQAPEPHQHRLLRISTPTPMPTWRPQPSATLEATPTHSPTSTPGPTATPTARPSPTPSLDQIVDSVRGSVVRIMTPSGEGSGTIFRPDGYILTNYHVVQDYRTVNVQVEDRYVVDGSVIGYDEGFDLAVVKIDGSSLPFLPFSTSRPTSRVEILTLGYDSDLPGESALTRGSLLYAPDPKLAFIDTGSVINPGNKGGPVITLAGEFIGITLSLRTGHGAIFRLFSLDDGIDQLMAGAHRRAP